MYATLFYILGETGLMERFDQEALGERLLELFEISFAHFTAENITANQLADIEYDMQSIVRNILSMPARRSALYRWTDVCGEIRAR